MNPRKRLPAICVILLILLSIQSFYQDTAVGAADPEDYLKIALKEPMDTLNPIKSRGPSTSQTVLDRIYEGMSARHEDTHQIIPWLAYDWSTIEESGDGIYDPNATYYDPKPNTVVNEGISTDELEVIIRFRKNITFHRSDDWLDIGEDWQSPKSDFTLPEHTMETMTAHDVLFTAEMILVELSKYDSSFTAISLEPLGDETATDDPRWVINGGSGMYDGMQLVDNYTIRVTLTEKWPRFYELAFPIVLPMKVWAKHTMLDPLERNAKNWACGITRDVFTQRNVISGTGPFMWTDWEAGSYVRMDKNREYFVDGTRDENRRNGVSLRDVDYDPKYPGITFKIMDNEDETFEIFEEGGIDAVGWSESQENVNRLMGVDGSEAVTSPELSCTYLSFNMRKPAFGYLEHPGAGFELGEWYGEDISRSFRKAVAVAVNKPEIINNIYNGYGDTTHSLISEPNKLFHNESVKSYHYDLERAKELLDEQNEIWQDRFSGFPNWDPPGYDEIPDQYPIPRASGAGDIYPSTETFCLLSVNSDTSLENHQTAINIASTLREQLGIQIEAKCMKEEYFISDVLLPSDYDIILHDWNFEGYESMGGLALLLDSVSDTENGLNLPGFRDPKFDRMVEDAGIEIDIAEWVEEEPPPPPEPPQPIPPIIKTLSKDNQISSTDTDIGKIFISRKYGAETYLEGKELPIESGEIINVEKRVKMLKDMQGMISKELPYSTLFIKQDIYVCKEEWQGWVTSPGGILNRYSFGNLEPPEGEGSVRINTPSNMMCNEENNVTIQILGEDLIPRENVKVKLICSHDEGVFSSKDDLFTDNNGFINATFIPPMVDDPTLITLRVITVDESGSALVMVQPLTISEFYMTAEVDKEFIDYDEQAVIELQLNSKDVTLDDVSVDVVIDHRGTGTPKLSRDFPIKMGSGQMLQFTFEALDVQNGTIDEYEIVFQGEKKGFQPAEESIKIQVQGGPIEEKENKNEDSPFPNITSFLLIVILLTYLKKKKPYSC